MFAHVDAAEKNERAFGVINVIMPSLMTSVLLLSIFFCTPAQKVQIGVVVLLSFRIFLLNVAGNIPKTSDHVPLLGELFRGVATGRGSISVYIPPPQKKKISLPYKFC